MISLAAIRRCEARTCVEDLTAHCAYLDCTLSDAFEVSIVGGNSS